MCMTSVDGGLKLCKTSMESKRCDNGIVGVLRRCRKRSNTESFGGFFNQKGHMVTWKLKTGKSDSWRKENRFCSKEWWDCGEGRIRQGGAAEKVCVQYVVAA